MQLCFINDLPSDEDDVTLTDESPASQGPTAVLIKSDAHPVPDLLRHEAGIGTQEQVVLT